MKVLVTGGAGFIGSHLVERLIARGDSVSVIDDFNDFYDPALKRRRLDGLQVDLRELDIRNTAAVRKTLEEIKPEVLVHLAARAGVRASLENPVLYAEVNVGGTLNLLEACRHLGIRRFVFASSSSVYGNCDRVPFREEDGSIVPVSPYGVTKLVGEHLCRVYHHIHGLRISVLRFFTVYGPRQRPDMAIHKFTRAIDEGREIEMFGDGTNRRDYTYSTDTLQGILGTLDVDDGFEVYNLGESQTVELRRLVEILEESLGKRAKIRRLPEQPGDVRQTYADITKARNRLRYHPEVPVEEGIRKFVEWYRNETKKT